MAIVEFNINSSFCNTFTKLDTRILRKNSIIQYFQGLSAASTKMVYFVTNHEESISQDSNSRACNNNG